MMVVGPRPARRSTTTTGCRTSTTSTRARTSPSAPSRSSATRTRATSRTRRRTRTCCTCSTAPCRCRSAAARRSSAAIATTPTGSSSSRAGSRRVLCLAGVAAVYYAGRQLWNRRTGLVAAAILCFAFLPVAFSRIAVTDVGTLAPVALALLFAVRIARDAAAQVVRRGGRRRPGWRSASSTPRGWSCSRPALALVLPLAAGRDRAALRAAALGRARRRRRRARRLPRHQPVLLHRPQDRAAPAARPGRAGRQPGQVRPGARHRRPLLPRQPDLGARLGRRRWPRPPAPCCSRGATACGSRCCSLFPVALFVYLSLQSRFFGRWLLPIYPALALLAGYAVVHAIESCARARRGWSGRRWPSRRVLLLWQPLAADARSMAVLGTRDTREIARQWLADERAPRAAHHHRAGGARALLLAGPRRPPAASSRARSSSTSSSATSARRTSSTAARCGPACSTATAARATAW